MCSNRVAILSSATCMPSQIALCAMPILRHHGLHTNALHTIFRATLFSPSCCICLISLVGYNSRPTCDNASLEAFLSHSSKLGFRADSAPTLQSICAEDDHKKLYVQHVLRHLVPPRDKQK